MKYSLECDVDAKVKIGGIMKMIRGSKDYILIPDKQGWLTSIKIIAKVAEPQKFNSRIEPGDGRVKAKFIIEMDPTLRQELIREFQELESIFSFETKGSLQNIRWDEPKEEVIPETDEEKAQVSVTGFHLKKEYPKYNTTLDEKTFESIVQSKHLYVSLVVPKAFYREGINEFHLRRYINAFYNFYFVLEDSYGQGKTRNKNIASAFKNSWEFKESLEWVIKNHIDKNERHRANIQKFCAEEKVEYDVDGLIELLQKVRGNLHHYSSKSSKRVGSPFNHDDFESIAFLTMGLALRTILQRIFEINKRARSENAKVAQ
jgi:hypothetical protein